MKKPFALLLCILATIILFGSSLAEEVNITFKEPAFVLDMGKKIKLDIDTEGISKKNLNIEYKSSDENVIVIKKGNAEAVGEGIATITCVATDENNKSYTAKCTATVIIPIKKLSVEEKNITLAQGPYSSYDEENPESVKYYEHKPTLTIEPQNASIQDLEWVSKNYSVASVSEDGTIRGEGYGKTTIIGTAKDGSKKSVKISVNVPVIYTSADKVVIDSPEGEIFAYSFTSISGISMTSIGSKGDAFTYENLSDKYSNISILRILPLKAGKGSLIFTRNGKSKKVSIEVKKSAITEELIDGMRPEFKEAMDEYRAWIDEYCAFMKKYDEGGSDIAMLADSIRLVNEMDRIEKELNDIDESTLNPEEEDYYLDTLKYFNNSMIDLMKDY